MLFSQAKNGLQKIDARLWYQGNEGFTVLKAVGSTDCYYLAIQGPIIHVCMLIFKSFSYRYFSLHRCLTVYLNILANSNDDSLMLTNAEQFEIHNI